VETYRKLFLASVLSVISPGSTKQIVVAELFCVLSLIVYVTLSPYDDAELTMTSSICQLQIWYILFISMLIKENVAISPVFIGASVVVAICFVVVYELFWCIVEFCPLPKRVDAFFDQFTLSKSRRFDKNIVSSFRDSITKSINILFVRDKGADHNSRIEDTDSHSTKVGKLNAQVEVLEQAREFMERDHLHAAKLGQVLKDRQQRNTEELERLQELMDRARDDVGVLHVEEGWNANTYGGSFDSISNTSDDEAGGSYLEVASDDESDVHFDDQQNDFGDNSDDDDVIFAAPGVQLVPPPSEEESLNDHLTMEMDIYEMEERTSGESGVGKLFQL
jgi:hypothetical protein